MGSKGEGSLLIPMFEWFILAGQVSTKMSSLQRGFL